MSAAQAGGGPEVMLVASNFPPVRGGSGAVYANLARCAAPRILVVAPRIGYSDGLPLIGWREYDRVAPFPVQRLPLLRTVFAPRRRMLGKVPQMARDVLIRGRLTLSVLRQVRRGVRAVCVGELVASGWLLHVLRWVPGVRTLVYVHGEEITTDDPYDPGAVRRRRALLAADHVVVVSRFTQRAVVRMLGDALAGRIVLVENGVDTTRFFPAARQVDLVERYGLGGQFVFITVCRLLEKKGVDQVLRAFAQLLPAFPGMRYLVVGTGPYEAELQRLAAELGIAGAVAFAGNVAEHELVAHYRLGDVFVMPNRVLPNGDTEGFGLVFLEANACGLPVIAGRDGGSVDAVTDGENGLVVDGNSVPALLDAMRRMRGEEALRSQVAAVGLRAAKAADWNSRAEAFLQACVS